MGSNRFLNLILVVILLVMIVLPVAILPVVVMPSEIVEAGWSYQNTGGTITTDGLYTVHTFNTSGTFYFVTPKAGNISVEAWGSGGGGGTDSTNGGGGGGGGAYAASNITVSAGNFTVVVAAGGAADTASAAPDSTFNGTTVVADGGTGTSTLTAGTGGTVAGSTGTIRYAGGNGGTGSTGSSDNGAGAGGSAGPDGAGGNGSNATATLGGDGGRGDNNLGGLGGTNVSGGAGNPGASNILGGGGGAGGDNAQGGGNAGIPGGGGGGAGEDGSAGRAGAIGLVVIRCLTADFYVPSSVQTVYTSGSGTYTVPVGVSTIDILVVAGGGSGAHAGAGGLVYYSSCPTSPGATFTYSVGAADTNSSFGSIIALAGGPQSGAGGSGGGGGGGAMAGALGLQPTSGLNGGGIGYGNPGGAGYYLCPETCYYTYGGGGGAGGAGAANEGAGGPGLNFSSVFGTSVGQSGWFAGGEGTPDGQGQGANTGGSGDSGVIIVLAGTHGLVSTDTLNSYDETSASVTGNITFVDYFPSTRRGFCYKTGWTEYPTTSDGVVYTDGSYGLGQYTQSVTPLLPGTVYSIRAYIVDQLGTWYGSPLRVYTLPQPPSITLTPQSNSFLVSWTKGYGAYYTNISRKAGSPPANLSDGVNVYYGTGTAFGDSTLTPGTTYYYLGGSVAMNTSIPYWYSNYSYSDDYGSANALCLTTPTVLTNTVTDIEPYSSTLHGTISFLGGTTATSWGFQWDTDSGYPYSNTVVSSGTPGLGSFSYSFGNLSAGTTYYLRAFALCSNGSSYGTETSFTTVSPSESNTLITIHDTCGVARTHLPIQANISTSAYINSGFLLASGLDQEIYESSSSRFSMLNTTVTNTSIGWIRTIIPSLVAYGSKDYNWYTGVRPSDTLQDSIIGTNGSITCSSSADFSIANSYNISWSGYINTSAVGPLFGVNNSFYLYSSGTETIGAYVNNSSVSALNTSYALASGSHSISMVGNSTYTGLYLDGVLRNSMNPGILPYYSALNIFMDTDVAVATRTATIEVDGYNVLDWGLRNIVTGNNLSDSSGKSHNGSITWGTMPSCYTITLGGSQPEEDYTPPEEGGGGSGTPEEVIPGVVPTANDSAWWRGTTDVSDARFSGLPMYGLFKRAADAGWGSVYVLYMFAMIATAVVLGLITYLATGSYLVASIAVGVTLFGASTTGVISGWIVVIYGATCATYITVARSL